MGLDAASLGIIKQYCWNDTDAEMRQIVEASISGEEGGVTLRTFFNPEPIKQVVARIVLLATTFGHPKGLFKDSIEKICSVVIRTQQMQKGSSARSSWTSSVILSCLLPSPTGKPARMPAYEQPIQDALPAIATLPRRMVCCYHIAYADNEKNAEVSETTQVDLETVIGKIEPAKIQREQGSASQELHLSLSQGFSQMEAD